MTLKRSRRRTSLATGLIVAALLLPSCGAGPAAPSPTPDPGSTPTGLNLTAEPTIIYLGHCGYAVWTGRRLLIFDYTEYYEQPPASRAFAQGYVNATEMKDLDVTVFVTHDHIDHNSPVIQGWQNVVTNIKYVYGWAAGARTGHYSISQPRGTLNLNGVEISTVFDHHDTGAEVAFLVSADGLVIFHGGDYQGIAAPGAPITAAEDMRYLATRAGRPDLFFIGAWVGEANLQMIAGLNPKVIFPMHYGGQESRYLQFATDLRAQGVTQPVTCPARRGDRYIYRNGQIVGP